MHLDASSWDPDRPVSTWAGKWAHDEQGDYWGGPSDTEGLTQWTHCAFPYDHPVVGFCCLIRALLTSEWVNISVLVTIYSCLFALILVLAQIKPLDHNWYLISDFRKTLSFVSRHWGHYERYFSKSNYFTPYTFSDVHVFQLAKAFTVHLGFILLCNIFPVSSTLCLHFDQVSVISKEIMLTPWNVSVIFWK